MALTTPRLSGDGARVRTDAPSLEPTPRRARLPEMAIGVVLMVGFSLAAVLWHMNATDKVPALALASNVARGEVIEPGDLRLVYVPSDEPIAHLPGAASSEVVGRVAVAALEEGTLLTRGHVVARASLGPDDGVIGLAMDPGQFPAPGLLPGDLVNVVGGMVDGSSTPDGFSAVLAHHAEVYAVEQIGTQGRQFVSLKMPEDVANRVAAAAERGPVRLVMVGR